MRILLAEDHPAVAASIATGLRQEGAAVDVAPDGGRALFLARVHPYDVVVLDRDLPEVHGDDVCRALNDEQPETKVLMLTASRTTEDVVQGLALGADDYLLKPFRFDELVARVHALARRAGPARPAVLTVGDLELDPARRVVTRGGRRIDLVRKEFGVLHALMAAGGDVVSTEDAARVGVGRERRPLLEHRADDGHEAAPQARRAGRHRDPARRRVPHVSRVRLRLTLFYALLLGATSAMVLGASYLLVRDHLYRTLETPVAHQAVAALASQYALAVIAVVLLAAGGGWLVSGEVLAPLGRAIASQQRFVANASHELRTPMTAIRTAAEVALRDPTPTVDRLSDVLRQTIVATEETDRLMASLLTLAAANAGTRHDDRVELSDVVRDALPTGAPIDTELHPTTVRGDAALLARAVANLVDNALRHGRRGGVVTVRLRDGELTVGNDGAPIPPTTSRASPSPSSGSARFGAGNRARPVDREVHRRSAWRPPRPRGPRRGRPDRPVGDPAGIAEPAQRSVWVRQRLLLVRGR